MPRKHAQSAGKRSPWQIICSRASGHAQLFVAVERGGGKGRRAPERELLHHNPPSCRFIFNRKYERGKSLSRFFATGLCDSRHLFFSLPLPPSLPLFFPPSRPPPCAFPLHSSAPISSRPPCLPTARCLCLLSLSPQANPDWICAPLWGDPGGNSARSRFPVFLPAACCLCHSSPTSQP